jgi:hypothetical protein
MPEWEYDEVRNVTMVLGLRTVADGLSESDIQH